MACPACLGVGIAEGVAPALPTPERFDLIGAALCLVGVAVIMYAPR